MKLKRHFTSVLFIISVILSSCASVRVTEKMVTEDQVFYTSLMVVYSDFGPNFTQMDEDFFENAIKDRFNKLDDTRVREQLHRSLKRNFEPTPLEFMEDYFPVQAAISFEKYMEKLKNHNSRAILLINRRGFWSSSNIIDGTSYTSPNASYNCFLLDKDTLEVVWMGNFVVNGTSLSGYDTIHNHLTRNLVRRLQRNKLIATLAF